MRGLTFLLVALSLAPASVAIAADRPTTAAVLEASTAGDWRRPDPADMLYLELDSGRVVFELATEFAPRHIDNIRKLVDAAYFRGTAIIRSQDNYVVQWGDPAGDEDDARTMGRAAISLAPEFYRPAAGLSFTPLDGADAYAAETGFVSGFPVGRDGPDGRAWLAHCYGMLGVGRANSPESGNGAELYVVIGHAPRHLDRNVTLLGRVIHGVELLSTLPRGTGPLGFYADSADYVPVRSLRFGSDLPAEERLPIEILRTDTETFRTLIEARRHRAEAWFVDPADAIGVCNVPLPVRLAD